MYVARTCPICREQGEEHEMMFFGQDSDSLTVKLRSYIHVRCMVLVLVNLVGMDAIRKRIKEIGQ